MSEDKIPFWETPTGKIVSHGVHEHVNATSFMTTKIITVLDKPEDYSKEYLLEMLSNFRTHIKRSNDAMDYVYENLKKLNGY